MLHVLVLTGLCLPGVGLLIREPEEAISYQAHRNAGHGKSDPGTELARFFESGLFSSNEDDTPPRRTMEV
jgi:hypothetical protein